jgi:hypothetical protein
MNWAELQRDWNGAAPLPQSYGTRLTDEDVQRIDGSRDELAACLRWRYGYGAEGARLWPRAEGCLSSVAGPKGSRPARPLPT